MQYRLRTILMFVAALCVALGLFAERTRRQVRGVVALQQQFANVFYDYHQLDERLFDDGRRSRFPEWLIRLLGRDALHAAIYVDLDSSQVTDQTLATLRELPHLKYLSMNNTDITNEGLSTLEHLPRLRVLWVHGPTVSAQGLAHLARLSRLEELFINDLDLSLKDLRQLHSMTALRRLVIHDCHVSDDSILRLQQALRHCEIDVLSVQPDGN